MSNQGTPIIISAPSGAGKTSLVNATLKSIRHIRVSISHTTRPMRPGEEHGVNYYFISEDVFLDKIKQNDFLEYATVFNHYYGTSKSSMENFLTQGFDVILEIDWQGARQVRQHYPNAISIFIFPPSLEVLESRLKTRAQDDPNIIRARMAEAKSELSHFNEFDYFIINDKFEVATDELRAIILSQRLKKCNMLKTHADIIKKLT